MAGLEHKTLALDRKAALDALSSDPGQLVGYASVFGNVDAYGDTIQPGAYLATIPSFIERGALHAEHDSRLRVGTISSAREDDHGLLIAAEFHSDQNAQRVRTQVLERLERGKFVGLSIGYVVEDSELRSDGVRVLKKIKLYEISEVSVPADEHAEVIAAKSADELETRATWSTSYVNSLPDGAFAIVLPGGEKDSEGKTTPRSLRKLPHHSADMTLDMPHLRNGLSRAPQITGVSDAQRSRAVAHLEKHLAAASKALELASKHEPDEPPLRIDHELRRRRLLRHGIAIGD